MHVLITGAAGMIGRKLAERLARDDIIRIHIEDELGGKFVA